MSALRRRQVAGGLLGAGLLGAFAPARAQPAPEEGTNYVRLAEPVPASGGGKIEVIEFFWYECPHCYAFEPALDTWSKRLPADVAFRRVPVWFREEPFGPQQRLFYALESMGLLDTLHRRVFNAIHADRVRLRTPDDMAAFLAKNGVDAQTFLGVYQSFGVQSKAVQARQTAAAYKIDAVPAMGVQGRYYTNGSLANAGPAAGRPNSNDRMLGVVDALVARVRSGAKG
jgi:thiol:disulfide interchange protein DsbA